MKKFLCHTILFVALFAICYVPILCMIGSTPLHGNIKFVPANYGHLRTRIADIENHQGNDILFIGSSHCYRTFDPRIFAQHGISIFNLGSSNQTPLQTLSLLESHLHTLRPKALVIEVHPDIITNSGEESAVDLISNCTLDASIIHMALKIHSARVINTLMYAYTQRHKSFIEDSIITVGTDVNGEQTKCPFAYVEGGFVELPAHRYIPQPHKSKEIIINHKQTECLKECVKLATQENIPVLLMEVPSTTALYESYTNHHDMEEILSGIAPYVNLNDSATLLNDNIHFFDEDHLNQDGVELLCQWMIRHIAFISHYAK